MKKDRATSKYVNAHKQVTKLREFYQHVVVFIFFVVLWLLFSHNISDFIISKTENVNSNFINWLKINLALVPVIWGLILLIYGLYIHKFKLSVIKNWEEKKIRELMNEDHSN